MTEPRPASESPPADDDDAINIISSDTEIEPPDLIVEVPMEYIRTMTDTPADGTSPPEPDAWRDHCRLTHREKDFGVELTYAGDLRSQALAADSGTSNAAVAMQVTQFKCNMCRAWSEYPGHFNTGARRAAENRIRHFMKSPLTAEHPTDNHTITCSLCEIRQPLRLSKGFLEQILRSNDGSYFEETHTIRLMDKQHKELSTGCASIYKYADHPQLVSPVQTVAAAYKRLATALMQDQRSRERSRSSRSLTQAAEVDAPKSAESTVQPAASDPPSRSPASRTSKARQAGLGRWFSPRKQSDSERGEPHHTTRGNYRGALVSQPHGRATTDAPPRQT